MKGLQMVADSNTPYLRFATLQDVAPFGSEVTFQFDRRANVFIGPNGVGKSAALDQVAGEGFRRLSLAKGGAEPKVVRTMEPRSVTFEDVTTVHVGATRAPLTPEMVLSDLQQLDVEGRLSAWLVWTKWIALTMLGLVGLYSIAILVANIFFGMEARWPTFIADSLPVRGLVIILPWVLYLLASFCLRSRRLFTFLTDRLLLSNALTYRSQVSPIFMFQTVASANRRWLRSDGSAQGNRRFRAAHDAANLALDCAKKIAPEVFTATASLGTGTIMEAVRTLGVRRHRPHTDSLSSVDTRSSSDRLHITHLSAGTQNTLLIAWYLALILAYSNSFKEGWKDLPAILFIDEIENHLHPVWQRRFIPVLLEQFPNLQIIATTHSPFPVAGLKAGQVHKLHQGDDGITQVEANEHAIVGLTADEILHRYLDVLDPTDLETAQAVEVLRWLESLDPLVAEKSAESWRKAIVEEMTALDGDDELTVEDILVMRWLTGKTKSPIAVALPLHGEAEHWRQSMIRKFHQYAGIDILSGGPAARQRRLWDEQIINHTYPEPKDVLDNEDSGVECAA